MPTSYLVLSAYQLPSAIPETRLTGLHCCRAIRHAVVLIDSRALQQLLPKHKSSSTLISISMPPASIEDWTVEDILDYSMSGILGLWSSTTRRMRMAGAVLLFMYVCASHGLTFDSNVSSFLTITFYQPTIQGTIPDVPRVYFDYGAVSPFNASKVALLVENRANPVLAPLMLHFMSVVPPDWRFRFMGSEESVAAINASVAIQHQVNIGKLDLTYIPKNMSTAGQELISRFLTNLWLYETVLQPAEWLLVFQTDSELLFTQLHPAMCLQYYIRRSLTV